MQLEFTGHSAGEEGDGDTYTYTHTHTHTHTHTEREGERERERELQNILSIQLMMHQQMCVRRLPRLGKEPPIWIKGNCLASTQTWG